MFDFYSASSQFGGRHVAPLRHINMILGQPVFALTPEYCVFSGEVANIDFIVFGLNRLELEPMIYHTGDEHANHYTSDAVNILPVMKKSV